MSDKQELSSAKIEQGWRDTFSTENPFCPCNLKSFTKAVRWAERAMLQAAPAEPAMHASAPTGMKCADCYMDKEACPTCYSAWWKARHPHSQQMPEGAPPAPVAATGFDREYVRAYLEELLIDKIGNPHTDPEVSKFLEWLAAPVAHSKSEYKRRVAMGDANVLPPAPVADGCEHCGGKVSNYSHGCPGCGAPVCCRRCCNEAKVAPVAVQPAPVAWLPIESAPRSKLAGQILTFRQGDSALHGRRNTTPAQKWQASGPWFQTSFWSEQFGIWVGWPLNTQPTHWTPLPPAPDASPSPAPVAELVVTDAQIDEASERKAFEAWASDQGFLMQRTVHGEDYQDLRTQGPWEAWQARAILAAHPTQESEHG